MPRFPRLLLILVTTAAVASSAAPATAQTRESLTVDTSTQIFHEMMSIPENSIPPALLEGSHAIAIIPNVIKAGFLVGGCYGRGVLSVRDPVANMWSNPIFVTLGGGSFGFQAGAQATDLVLIFRNRRSVDSFLLGRGKFTLGADAAVAAGPLGRRAAVGTDVRLSSEILTYSRSRGLFAGVSLEGAVLKLDWDSLATFYGSVLAPAEVLQGHPEVIPPSAARLKAWLAQYTGMTPRPAIVPADNPVPETAIPAQPVYPAAATQAAPAAVLHSTATGPQTGPATSTAMSPGATSLGNPTTVRTARRWRRPIIDPDFLETESPSMVLRGQSSEPSTGAVPAAAPAPTPTVLHSTPTGAQDPALTPAANQVPAR